MEKKRKRIIKKSLTLKGISFSIDIASSSVGQQYSRPNNYPFIQCSGEYLRNFYLNNETVANRRWRRRRRRKQWHDDDEGDHSNNDGDDDDAK